MGRVRVYLTLINRMKVLIFGGSGYIGGELINRLLSYGYEVGNVSRRPVNIAPVAEFSFDEDIESVLDRFEPQEIIYLSACYNNENINEIIDVNIRKPLEIIERIRRISNCNFTYIGSYWQFGDATHKGCAIDAYSASKGALVSFFDYYNTYTSVRCREIVLYGTYGEYDNRGKLLDYLLKMAKIGEKIEITEGEQELNLSEVGEVCKVIIEQFKNTKNNKIQIKSSSNYSPKQLVDIINKNINIEVEFGAIPYRDVELMNLWDNKDYESVIIQDKIEDYIRSKLLIPSKK
ncbi:hypothetical protein H735_24975 [Vibrio owensii CAIM 1854 = LMG 25443]|uniref:NAD-dependent epimerase/dehydratase domain-containing protein n=2 Tax=Vibrio owensii TaxID=696485 RepID=A0A0C1W1U4_9VIBR|nr:hypothetical protein H735_24975 [Vibrio owensii CAIM 1854 = LMG 25443]